MSRSHDLRYSECSSCKNRTQYGTKRGTRSPPYRQQNFTTQDKHMKWVGSTWPEDGVASQPFAPNLTFDTSLLNDAIILKNH